MRGEEVSSIAVGIADDRFSYAFNGPVSRIEEAAE